MQPIPFGEPVFPVNAVAYLEDDRRFPGRRLCRVLRNDTFPLYQVRVAEPGASRAPGQYEAKAGVTIVTHSKMSPIKPS